ncbi:MAG: hypothetical protein AB7O52_15345 [Planctomycetota bacterium]
MGLTRSAYVVGGAISPFIGKFHPDFIWKGHPDFGKRDNPSLEMHLHDITVNTLKATGVAAEQIDRGVVGNFVGELFSQQGHLGALAVAGHPGLAYKPFHRVEGACASGGLAVLAAADAIAAGADLILVLGAEVQTTVNAKVGADYLARASHYESERSLDPFTFPCLFARRMKAYFDRHGGDPSDLAPIVVKAYANAARNPKAHMRHVAMGLDQAARASDKNPLFLENEDFREVLKISDCSQVSDGAAGLVLASAEGLAKIGRKPKDCVELVAYGHATGPLGQVKDLTTLDVTATAVQRAFRSAGWDAASVDVAEVHDCFSITEALMYEAMGLCAVGEGVRFGAEGHTAIDGKIPVNTGGGLMAFGHPVGATGVKQVLEIQRQLTGQCGDYQIGGSPRRGACVNMGGDDRTAVVTLLRYAG